MYALLSINHSPGEALSLLEQAIGLPHRPAAALESTFPESARLVATGNVKYSASNAAWVVLCSASLSTQLQLVVSSSHGNLKRASEDIWLAFRSTAQSISPTLERLEILDPSSTEAITRGIVGLRPVFGRPEYRLAIWPGVVTAVGIGIALLAHAFPGSHSADPWLAGSPAIILAAVAIVLAIREGLSGRVTWQG